MRNETGIKPNPNRTLPNQTGIKAREKRAAQRARRKEKKQEKKKEKKAQAKRDKKTKKAPNQLSASNPNLRPDVADQTVTSCSGKRKR